VGASNDEGKKFSIGMVTDHNMRKVFPVDTAVKPREPECIQWSL
jgi:hypothetical protein